jgi:hypothetical protein
MGHWHGSGPNGIFWHMPTWQCLTYIMKRGRLSFKTLGPLPPIAAKSVTLPLHYRHPCCIPSSSLFICRLVCLDHHHHASTVPPHVHIMHTNAIVRLLAWPSHQGPTRSGGRPQDLLGRDDLCARSSSALSTVPPLTPRRDDFASGSL